MPAKNNTAAPEKARISHEQKLAKRFAAAVQENMSHEMTWIGNWYTELARARLADRAFAAFGVELESLSLAQRLAFGHDTLMQVLQGARSISSHSTGLGFNATREAELSAAAELAQGLAGSLGLRARNDALWAAALDAPEASAPEAALAESRTKHTGVTRI